MWQYTSSFKINFFTKVGVIKMRMKNSSRLYNSSTVLLFALWVIFSPLFSLAQDDDNDFDEELEKTAQIIVMLKADYNGVEEFGTGIIFGRQKDRLLIATAYHILHKGEIKPGKISISLRALPGKFFNATLLKHTDDGGADIAVIEAKDLARQGFKVCSLSLDRLGVTADLKRRDSVYPIGNPNGVAWAIPPEADKVSQITGNDIVFQSSFISSGHSGGALIDKNATIVGMTVADQPPFGRAINIDVVLKQVKIWGYPVQLINVLDHGRKPLHAAAFIGDTSAIKNILQTCGDNVNALDEHNSTPLHYAAYSGSVEALTLLIKAGAKVNVQDGDGDPPIQYALVENHVKAAKLLIDAGADIKIKNHDGRAAIYWAHPVEELQLLIKAGGDVNHADNYGYTPLQIAALQNDIESIKLLLKSGADVNKAAENGDTPLINAVKKQSEEAVNILLKAGAKVNVKATFGYTPLMDATIGRWKTGVRILIKAGADINALTDRGEDALYLAKSHGYPEMAALLRSLGAKE